MESATELHSFPEVRRCSLWSLLLVKLPYRYLWFPRSFSSAVRSNALREGKPTSAQLSVFLYLLQFYLHILYTPPPEFNRTSREHLYFLSFCASALSVCVSVLASVYGFQCSVSATAHLADAGFHMIIQNALCSTIV